MTERPVRIRRVSVLGLRARLAVLVALALTPAFGLIVYSAREQQREAVDRVRLAAVRTLRLAAADQEEMIEGARGLLTTLASLGAVTRHDAAACGAVLRDILGRSPRYTTLAAAAPGGEIVCAGTPVGRGASVAGQPWFREVVRTPGFVLGGYAVDPRTGKPSVTLARPALDDQGALRAVVFLGLDLSWLNQRVARAALPRGSVLVVLDARGLILARHPEPGRWVGKSIAGTPFGGMVLGGADEGTAEATFLDSIERVFAFASIGGTDKGGGIRIVIGIPIGVAYGEARRGQARLVILALVVLGAFALAWAFGRRYILRPLGALAEVTRRLGEGDLAARSGLAYQGGEVGQLARAFDEMAGALQAHQRRLLAAERLAVESRYAWILEGTAEAVVAVDVGQRIVLFNRGAEEIFGYAAREVLGEPLDLLLPAGAVEAHRRHVDEFGAGPVQAVPMGERREVTGRRKDGTEFPAEASISRLTRDGETLFTAILRDVSERRVSEAALRNITEGVAGATGGMFFRLLTKHLSVATGADYVLVGELHGDEQVETLAVCSGGEIAGNFTYDLRGTPCERVATKSLCSHPRGVREEFPDDRLLAEWGVEAFMGVPLLDSTGKPLGLLVVAHRAPLHNERLVESLLRTFALRAAAELERERSERALRESERSLEAVVETAPNLIVLTDPDGRIVLFNRACEELTGYGRQEVIGRTIPELFLPPEWIPVVEQRFADPYAPEVREPHENPWRTKSGGERLIEWHCTVAPALKSGRPGILGIGLDVTEQRRGEEQLRQSQRMEAVGKLAGGIAHDFNNLLTVIMGRIQLLLSRSRSPDPITRDLELIRKTAERATTLTRQLLAFSRRQVLQLQVLDLNALVENLSAMLRRLIGEDVELVFVPGGNLAHVKADPGQLEQVILNLAVNARDAMPRGGRLTLETMNVELDAAYARSHAGARPGPHVMLAVSDTGTGIPPEVLPRIFEPFFTTKEPGKGTGLGLATVYGIIKQSDGNVWVYSELGQGTTFKIYLPRVEEPAAPAPVRPPAAGVPRGDETILLVEDEDDLRTLTREILEGLGYTVLEAAHPGEAPLIAERHASVIHLLLTDVVMPRMSGRELARRLAEARPEMKVLYVSGYTDNAVVHHGVLDPGTPFLEKPFSPDVLARKVREVLDAS